MWQRLDWRWGHDQGPLLSCSATAVDLTAGTGGHGAGGQKMETLWQEDLRGWLFRAAAPLKDVAAEFDTVQGTQSAIARAAAAPD